MFLFQPILPSNAACQGCHKGEKKNVSEEEGELLECGICWYIHHAKCFKERYGHDTLEEGIINEDLPSSWECPNCVLEGKQGTSQVQAATRMIMLCCEGIACRNLVVIVK